MANVVSALDQKAKSAVQALVAWVDLGITIIEKLAMLGLVILLLGAVNAEFKLIPINIPTMAPLTLLYLALAWSLLKGRISLSRILDLK